jgi:hypothetical protein
MKMAFLFTLYSKMRQKAAIIALIPALMILICLNGCKKEKGNCDAVSISKFGLTTSHHTGEDCLECHKEGGSGNGCFAAGGTVYDSTLTKVYTLATVRLYSDAKGKGELKATIEVDGNGNFYTTDVIRGITLYPAVTGITGTTLYMNGHIAKGSCNGCHGVITKKIWVK